MGIFIAVFVMTALITSWLFFTLHSRLRRFQKKLFLASALSAPFLMVRLVYSALGDYNSNDDRFALLNGNTTIYLCMDVLEEIAAMVIIMALGMSAVLEQDFFKVDSLHRCKRGGANGTEQRCSYIGALRRF
jgi:hypothetical protein